MKAFLLLALVASATAIPFWDRVNLVINPEQVTEGITPYRTEGITPYRERALKVIANRVARLENTTPTTTIAFAPGIEENMDAPEHMSWELAVEENMDAPEHVPSRKDEIFARLQKMMDERRH